MDPARRSRILTLALPIIGGMVSQNVLNLIDTAMVGSLGNAALAAVGLGSFVNFMSVAFFTGFSSGVQAMAARRIGEGKPERSAFALNGAIILSIVLGIPVSILLYNFAPVFFPWIIGDPDVVAAGVPYYQARVLAVLAVGCNFSFRGFWNGTDRSALYMRTLIVMHSTNVVLNYLLIFGKFGFPEMGATGAGVASALATFLGTGYYFYMGFTHARPNGFLKGLPTKDTVASLFRLLLPAGIQQFFFATGMTVLLWIVGLVGTAELAVTNVLINLLLVAILIEMGFGMAAATLVGQALGANDVEGARRWGWNVISLSLKLVSCITLPAFLFPDLFLMPFIRDPETLELARWPLRILALSLPFDAIGMVLMNALQGAGDNRRVMIVVVGLQWFLFLPVAYLVGPQMGYGLTAIWLAQVIYRSLQSLIFMSLWKGHKWTAIKV